MLLEKDKTISWTTIGIFSFYVVFILTKVRIFRNSDNSRVADIWWKEMRQALEKNNRKVKKGLLKTSLTCTSKWILAGWLASKQSIHGAKSGCLQKVMTTFNSNCNVTEFQIEKSRTCKSTNSPPINHTYQSKPAAIQASQPKRQPPTWARISSEKQLLTGVQLTGRLIQRQTE